MVLTSDEMQRIMTDVGLGRRPRADETPEQAAFRREVAAELRAKLKEAQAGEVNVRPFIDYTPEIPDLSDEDEEPTP